VERERKRLKWAKGMSRDLVSKILQLQPDPPRVEFIVKQPEYVVCRIHTEDGIGMGLAICSVLDNFDYAEGKNKAAGRAVRALTKRASGDRIRNTWELFPNSWPKYHIERILSIATGISYKSMFVVTK
jgi:hypothetical protein